MLYITRKYFEICGELDTRKKDVLFGRQKISCEW
jgi:hypothetical protein